MRFPRIAPKLGMSIRWWLSTVITTVDIVHVWNEVANFQIPGQLVLKSPPPETIGELCSSAATTLILTGAHFGRTEPITAMLCVLWLVLTYMEFRDWQNRQKVMRSKIQSNLDDGLARWSKRFVGSIKSLLP